MSRSRANPIRASVSARFPPSAPTPQTVIVTYKPGDKSELKPGTKIFVAFAKKLPDGTLEAPRVNYGRDGVAPPM